MQTLSTAEAIKHLQGRAIYSFLVGALKAIQAENTWKNRSLYKAF